MLYVGPDYKPHCLARKFRNSTEVQKTGNPFEPEALGELLQRADYESFNLGLEDGPHLSLPLSVQGDFLFFTAPNGMPLPFSLFTFAKSCAQIQFSFYIMHS